MTSKQEKKAKSRVRTKMSLVLNHDIAELKKEIEVIGVALKRKKTQLELLEQELDIIKK
jgi:hypothetical protein